MTGTEREPSNITSYVVAARIGVGIAFIAPMLWFIVRYWWTYRTMDGLLAVLAQGAIAGVAATIEYALTNPVESLLYSIGMYLLWIFALGRGRRRKGS
ncbi:hypothetical protein ACWDTG_25955 [Rhodococcus zopfii]